MKTFEFNLNVVEVVVLNLLQLVRIVAEQIVFVGDQGLLDDDCILPAGETV